MAAGFGKVFEIGPVFRANPSFTSRHDTEFTSVDMELSWIDSHEDVMAVEERWLAHVLGAVAETHGERIRETFGTEVAVPALPFPRVTLEQAKELLREAGHEPPGAGHDLDPPSERKLSELIAEREGSEFVFVTDYPTTVRPFYHMRHEDDQALTKSFDLLWRGIELTTGAQREHRYDRLLEQAEEKGVETDSIQYYLDFFRFGAPPHGGFGFGLTRLLMQMLAQDNVREVTFLYRGPAPAHAVGPMARVLVSIPPLDGCLDALAGHELIEGPPGSDPAAEALLCPPVMPVDRQAIAAMPALRAIALAGAGTDAVDLRAARERGIEVLTAGEALVETTADLAFALILSASRLTGEAERALRDGQLARLGLRAHFRARRLRCDARARRLRRDRPRRRPPRARLRDERAAPHAH